MARGWLAGLALLVLLVAGDARAQTIQAGGLELDLTGRLQVQWNTTSVAEDDLGPGLAPAGSALEVRRLYFGTAFAFDDWLTGKIQANFAGGVARLEDGYIDAALTDGFSVRMGQFKKPFGLFELESNTRILTIERAVRIRGLEDLVGVPGEAHFLLDASSYLGHHAHLTGPIGWSVGVFNGEGQNAAETQGSKAFAGRLTWAVEDRPLVIGGGVSAQPTGEFDVDGDEISATAFALDAEWGEFRGDGLHVMAEVMFGDNPLLLVTDEPPTMVGGQVAAAWFTPRDGRVEGYEPVLRVSWADPNTDVSDDEGLLLTPGMNLYFSGRNRFMVNGEAYLPAVADVDTEFALVAQFQIYF